MPSKLFIRPPLVIELAEFSSDPNYEEFLIFIALSFFLFSYLRPKTYLSFLIGEICISPEDNPLFFLCSKYE